MLGIQWHSVGEQARAQFFLLWLLFLPVHWMGRKELSQQHNQYNQVYWLTTTDLSWYRRNETKKTFQIFKYLDNFLGATLYMYTGKWMPCSGDVKWDSYFTFLRVSSVVSIQLPVCTVTARVHVRSGMYQHKRWFKLAHKGIEHVHFLSTNRIVLVVYQ